MLTQALAVLLTQAAATPPPALPGWMAGCWIEEKGEVWTEECWTTARAGIMIGSGRSGVGNRLKSWESMQIVVADNAPNGERVRLAFWAAPRGGRRTLFAWDGRAETGITFFNVAHDYPQRIRYWRDGETLNAETSLADGSKAMRWRYRRSG